MKIERGFAIMMDIRKVEVGREKSIENSSS